ncbi:amino acid permease/ SLC12A domain-containing protein [Mycena polygramma]|nr:amino acid permease/ SLC12A domain-containing protein [Mycena polygramma]
MSHSDIEKKATSSGDVATESVVRDENAGHMHRSLKGRQVSMIGIAGTIGTGLFLGSGKALATGGSVGVFIGYLGVGVLVDFRYTLGEMMVWDPSAGGFIEFSTRYVDPAMGFAMGWQFWFQTVMGAPVEITAASIVISFWDHNDSHRAIYIIVMLIGIVLVNLAGVKYFGEFEFVFATIKIATVVGLIIMCLIVDLGGAPDHDRRGFRYWREAPFNSDFNNIVPSSKARFLGFWAVLTQAAFSYSGIEGLAMICLEASNPRRTMRTAVRAIFYRILLLYVLSVLVICWRLMAHQSLVMRSADISQPEVSHREEPALLQANAQATGTGAESPFVIIIEKAGIKVLAHIINAVVLTSAFSSGNEFLYSSSRSLFMLAQEGKAPRIFARVMKNGVPVYAIAVNALFGCLGYLVCGKAGANDAFNWLANITTLGSLITWIGIAIAHIRWYNAMKVQGISRDVLPFKSWTQPYGAWIVLISFSIIMLFNAKRTKLVPLAEMDCSTHYVEDSVVYSKY